MFYRIFLVAIILSASASAEPSLEDKQSEAGKYELQHAYENSRPQWSYDAFWELNQIWAKQVSASSSAQAEREFLLSILPRSPEFWKEIRKRYGLHPAPYPNDDLPLGMTKTKHLLDNGDEGISVNCQFCHSTYLFERSHSTTGYSPKFVQGIPNVFADLERLHQDLSSAADLPPGNVMVRNHERNTFTNHADYFGMLVGFLRPHNPKRDVLRYNMVFRSMGPRSFGVLPQYKEELIEEFAKAPPIKTQPWVNYRFKAEGKTRALYVNGGFDGDTTDVTYAMTFSLDPDGADYLNAKKAFKDAGPQYFKSLRPAPYPFPVNGAAAKRGSDLFHGSASCFKCHGTYRQNGTEFELTGYPKRIVPLATIGTDPERVNWKPAKWMEDGKAKFIDGSLIRTDGYIAPPLVGIWSRAPYLHNGSVPTLRQILDSKTRLATWYALPDSSRAENYDEKNLGWKLLAKEDITREMEPYYRKYDPGAHIGLSNKGHTFGDSLSDTERDDLLEFLKLL